MQDKTYNGWKNYETWNVNLWLNNDEGLYNQFSKIIKDLKSKNYSYPLEKYVRDEVESMVLDEFESNGKFGDLDSRDELNAVDFEEIAKNNI